MTGRSADRRLAERPEGASTARDHLERARRTARDNLAEARRLVWDLRPEALATAPLGEALGRLATVKTHRLHAYAKLGVDDRTAAVVVALERGIIALPRRR